MPGGLYYYRARFYDPASARFLSEDPIGVIAGPNPFAAFENSPLLFRDPGGLKSYYGSPSGLVQEDLGDLPGYLWKEIAAELQEATEKLLVLLAPESTIETLGLRGLGASAIRSVGTFFECLLKTKEDVTSFFNKSSVNKSSLAAPSRRPISRIDIERNLEGLPMSVVNPQKPQQNSKSKGKKVITVISQ